ncbi:MAG: transglycosylase domain-containing protein [Pseudomonadota bacterium]
MSSETSKPRRKPGLMARAVRFVLRLVWRILWWIGSRTALLVGAVVGIATLAIHAQLPEVDDLLDGRERGSVTLFDRHGEVFAWRGEQGGVLMAGEMSPHLVNAVIATEDKRFYDHWGISPRGIASAIRINLSEGRGPLTGHGGSTITQQTAKLVFLGTQRTMTRKLMEIPYAFAMEIKYSKEEILSIYMNRAYLGAGSNGFDAAARRYFGQSARTVEPAEAAMLAGLLKAPSRFAPTTNLTRARNRADLVLRLMHEQNYLSEVAYTAALANPATLSKAAAARAGGAYADWIMETGPALLTQNTQDDILIQTTFDARLQRAAEGALEEVFDELVREGSNAQAAIVIMSRNGAVRAMVGGRDIGPSAGQFNRATQALRQPGSAFKAVVYAAALEEGFRPDSVVMDAPLTIDVPGSGPWSPKNYTREYLGRITLAEAFARSTNTVAVRVSEDIGRDAVRDLALDLGWQTDLAGGPALARGVSETTLLTLTGLYATFLNDGLKATPHGLMRAQIRGETDPLMQAGTRTGARVLTPESSRQMVWLLGQVMDANYGTGTRARLEGRPAAGKTGTTQAARDAWFVGFTGDYVAGVWMGYDDNTPLTGVTGGGLPAEIWKRTMLRVHEGMPVEPLPSWQPGGQFLRVRIPLGDARTPETRPSGDGPGLIESILQGILGGGATRGEG